MALKLVLRPPVRRALLLCGVWGALAYVATDLIASALYPGYSFADQAVSELFAIGAPTSGLVVPFFSVGSVLLAAFALGVWSSSGQSRSLRLLALMLLANALNGLLLWNFFPMHVRGAARGFTDTMHLILAVNPSVLLSVVFGAAAFRGWFRLCSVGTILVLLAPAVFAFLYVPAVEANEPTPGLGLAERTAQYGYFVWQVILAAVLLREQHRLQDPADLG